MKLFGALLAVLALAALCCGTTPEESSTPSADSCDFYSKVYPMVSYVGEKCAEAGATPKTAEDLQKARELDDFRGFFVDYCQRNSTVRDCLAEKATMFEKCQIEKYIKVFEIYRNILETILDAGCVEGGGKLAKVWYGLTQLFNRTTAKIEAIKCGESPRWVLEAVGSSEVDLSSSVFILYQEMAKFKECVSKIQLDQPFRDVADGLMDEVIRTSKCVHPTEGALVQCGSIDASLVTSPTICHTKGFRVAPVYDALVNEAASCFDHAVTQDESGEELTGDMERLREDFKVFCLRSGYAKTCLNGVAFFAGTCLNETQSKEFGVLSASMQSALVSACSGDGKRLADIMFEVYRLKKASPGHGHAVWECADAVKTARGGRAFPARNLRFYREMEAFKGCLVDKLSADQTSVDAATAVIDEIRGTLLCLHPEDGTTVLCETLATKP